jgi:hypothetical protein
VWAVAAGLAEYLPIKLRLAAFRCALRISGFSMAKPAAEGGYPAWIRTKNNASKGRCVTVTPRGNEIFDFRLAIADLQFSIQSPDQDLNRNSQIAICKLAREECAQIILRKCAAIARAGYPAAETSPGTALSREYVRLCRVNRT